jgi:hypothetical protein
MLWDESIAIRPPRGDAAASQLLENAIQNGVAGDAQRPVRTIYHRDNGTLRAARYTV